MKTTTTYFQIVGTVGAGYDSLVIWDRMDGFRDVDGYDCANADFSSREEAEDAMKYIKDEDVRNIRIEEYTVDDEDEE